MNVELEMLEVEAMIDWHRRCQYESAAAENYVEAVWHKKRVEELNKLINHKG